MTKYQINQTSNAETIPNWTFHSIHHIIAHTLHGIHRFHGSPNGKNFLSTKYFYRVTYLESYDRDQDEWLIMSVISLSLSWPAYCAWPLVKNSWITYGSSLHQDNNPGFGNGDSVKVDLKYKGSTTRTDS